MKMQYHNTRSRGKRQCLVQIISKIEMNLSKRCHSYWYIKHMFENKMMQVFILFIFIHFHSSQAVK